MTDITGEKPDLGSFGVFGHYSQFLPLSAEQVQEIEALGYGAIWAGGSPPALSLGQADRRYRRRLARFGSRDSRRKLHRSSP